MIKQLDNLGTEISLDSAEMYTNTNNMDYYKYCYTGQQSNAPVVEPQAAPFPFPSASHSVCEEKKKNVLAFEKNNGSKPKKYQQRKITTNDYLVEIFMSINNIKNGQRYSRMTSYLNLKEVNDKKYSMFYTSRLTSAHDEIRRRIIQYDNRPLLSVYDEFINLYGKDCLLGRLKLNPRKYPIGDEHRSNHKHSLLCVYPDEQELHVNLYLMDEYYEFVLDQDMTDKQKEVYERIGIWQRDMGESE